MLNCNNNNSQPILHILISSKSYPKSNIVHNIIELFFKYFKIGSADDLFQKIQPGEPGSARPHLVQPGESSCFPFFSLSFLNVVSQEFTTGYITTQSCKAGGLR